MTDKDFDNESRLCEWWLMAQKISTVDSAT
jgi:hypothetical protein